MYYLYILKCKDKTLYTGITTDLERRIYEHNSSKLGAKYTSARRPVTLVYSRKFKDRSKASKASKEEARIKNLKRLEKLEFINIWQSEQKGLLGSKKISLKSNRRKAGNLLEVER